MKYENGYWHYKGIKGVSIESTYYQYLNWLGAQRYHGVRDSSK